MEASIFQHFRPAVYKNKWILEARGSPWGKRYGCQCWILSLEAKLVNTEVEVRARGSDRAVYAPRI